MAGSSRQPAYALARALFKDVPSPPVSEAAAWAKQYPSPASPFASSPRPYINLAQGVPSDLPTKEMRARMAHEAARDAHHGYSMSSPALLDALANRMNSVYRDGDSQASAAVTPDDICLTAGCNMASEFAFRTIADSNANEGIVLPTPFYFNHSMQLLGLAISPIALKCHSPSYLPSVDDFVALLDKHRQDATLPKIKGIALVTPNNPTGAIYPAELISAFASVCRREKIALILDETYRDFLVDEQGQQKKPHDLFLDPSWRDTVIHLYSFSKSFAIPGHRLGAIVAHPSLISYAASKQDHSTTADDASAQQQQQQQQQWTEFGPLAKALDNTIICAPRFDTQEAVAWAIDDAGEQEWRKNTALALRRRAERLRAALASATTTSKDGGGNDLLAATEGAAAGWTVESVGGYYAFVTHPFDQVGSVVVARGLALLVGLGVLPGSYFMPQDASEDKIGAKRIRISLANVKDESLLDEVPQRMAALSALWKEKGQGWGVL